MCLRMLSSKKIDNDDMIGLVGFSSSAYNYSDGLTSDMSELEDAIAEFERQADSGGTYMNRGIETAASTAAAFRLDTAGRSKRKW